MSLSNPRATTAVPQRRSQRIMLSVPVTVRGEQTNGKPFVEDTTTLVVSAHGALLQMKEAVKEGQNLEIRNIHTQEEIVCTVRDITMVAGGAEEVGVEFDTPSPRFWRVSFPPLDWSPRSPEAKRYETPPPSVPKPVK